MKRQPIGRSGLSEGRVVLVAALAVALLVAPSTSGAPTRASGTLQLNASLTQHWRLSRDFCPQGTPAVANCLRSVGEAEIAGLGRVTSTYSKFLPGDDANCFVMHNSTALVEVQGKGTLELAKTSGPSCSGPAPREDGPWEFTVTGGTGTYAGASGSLVYRASVSALDGGCQCGTARDTWTGTLTVPGVDFDLTAPTLKGAVSKTVRAPKGVKRVRVRYLVTAIDDVDGSVVVSCTPRSGSFFPLGRTKVTCSASDSSGNTRQARFTITVKRRAS